MSQWREGERWQGKQGTGGPRRTVGGCHWRETGDLLGKVIFCSLFQMVFFVSLTFLTDFQENKCSLYTVDTCCLLADQRGLSHALPHSGLH